MIEKDKVIALHEVLEELSVCREGIHNPAQLDSAIAGQQWYDDSVDMYIHVAYNIDAYHIFKDGNKRTAFLVLKELNYLGVYFDDNRLKDEILALADNTVPKDIFIERIRKCLL